MSAPAAAENADDRSKSLGGVLFDLDGTLVDSERLWDVVDGPGRRPARRQPRPPEVRAATTGQSIPFSVKMLLDDIGSDQRRRGDHRRCCSRITAEIFAEDLLWQPGAEQLIDADPRGRDQDRAGHQLAASAGRRRAGGLLGAHRFDVTICGDEVTRGKPDPYPYLHAMELLGLSAAQCLAVEDSPSGTQAAVAAGIPVLVVPSEVPVPEGPGRIFASSLLDSTATELQHIHHEFRRYRRAHGG